MSKVVSLTTPRQAEEEAVLWISRLDRSLSKSEEEELFKWVRSSEFNKQALLGLASIWDDMDRLHQLGELCPLSNQDDHVKHGVFQNWQWPTFASVVFTVLAFVVFTTVDLSYFKSDSMHQLSYETSIGEQSTVSMPDTSQITLNTNSKLEVFYDRQERRISLLQGEAHFDVTHDPDRPFLVSVGNQVVRAVGTAFNIEVNDNNEIEVVVDDGRVTVGRSSIPIYAGEAQAGSIVERSLYSVGQGEKIFISQNIKTSQVELISDVEMSDRLSWKSGKLIFRGEPLSEVLQEVERYTNIKIVLSNGDLKPVLIAGIFQAGDVEGLLSSFKRNFNIDHTWTEPNRIVLEQTK